MTLPNFLILGPPKSGSTSLYEYLRQHPDVFMPELKEPYYFGLHWNRGQAWYESVFAAWSGQRAVGEASTWYLQSKTTAERVQALLPHARLVFVFRDPVQRLWSDYRFHQVRGKIPAAMRFREFVDNTPKQLKKGRYLELLLQWEAKFPPTQRHIVVSEDLAKRPAEVVADIFRFLDVDDTFVPRLDALHNVTPSPKNPAAYVGVHRLWHRLYDRTRGTALEPMLAKPKELLRPIARALFMRERSEKMAPADLEWARAHYAEHNRRLAEHIGRDLSHWT